MLGLYASLLDPKQEDALLRMALAKAFAALPSEQHLGGAVSGGASWKASKFKLDDSTVTFLASGPGLSKPLRVSCSCYVPGDYPRSGCYLSADDASPRASEALSDLCQSSFSETAQLTDVIEQVRARQRAPLKGSATHAQHGYLEVLRTALISILGTSSISRTGPGTVG